MNGDGVDIGDLQTTQSLKALPDQDHYEVLEIERNAHAEEIERAYALTRAAYSPEGLAVYSVYDEQDAVAIRDRVEEAYRVLSNAETRREYDEKITDREGSRPDAV
ncbi:DnaJ domain-containing protein, partial [Myxococcota bacterium]|nr:DnaJ domain-containing protein [Myxococcota bacterium]